MKKSLVIISLLMQLVLVNLYGQVNVYHPLPDTNAIWRVDWQSSSHCYGQPPYLYEYAQYQYTLQGDTAIGSHVYKKVFRSGICGGICLSAPVYCNNYICGIRQDTLQKKVYIKYLNYADTILYDFSLHAGDTLKARDCFMSNTYTATVTATDSVLVGGSYHKKFILNNNTQACIIEGVGAVTGLLEASTAILVSEEGFKLICFTYQNNFYPANASSCNPIATSGIANLPDINFAPKITPNPFSTQATLEFNNPHYQTCVFALYNACGQLVQSVANISTNHLLIEKNNLPAGLYFFTLQAAGQVIANGKLIVQ